MRRFAAPISWSSCFVVRPATQHQRRLDATMTQVQLKLNALAEQVNNIDKRCCTLEGQHAANQLIAFYGKMLRTPLDINQVVASCRNPDYRPAIFCHRELPVLLAHLVAMLDHLPNGLAAMGKTRSLRQELLEEFKVLVDTPVPDTPDLEKAFISVVDATDKKLESLDVVRMLAFGVVELRQAITRHRVALSKDRLGRVVDLGAAAALYGDQELQDSIDHFYSCFVQFSFLSQQLVHLRQEGHTGAGDDNLVGIVDTRLDLMKAIRAAIHRASLPCSEKFGDVPEVDIVCDDEATAIPHVHEKVVYILTELLKNAFRATIETHMCRDENGIIDCADMPSVKVRLFVSGEKHASICVEDFACGIARADMMKIFSYAYTTADVPALRSEDEVRTAGGDDAPQPDELAGFGYGLPMSRIYARMFGGDLQIQSVEGCGTRAVLFMRKELC